MYDNLTSSIILTNRCLLHCSHCFLGARREDDMTMGLDTVGRITARVREISKKASINWGGGEPLLLGRDFMKKIVSLDCFGSGNITNTLYSTFLVDIDHGWKDILTRFDSLIFSLDSYRMKDRGFDMKKALSNVSLLEMHKAISYTPSPGDSREDVALYYRMSSDIGAEVFHMGFLYGDILPADLYIRILDIILDLQAFYGKPRIGFFEKLSEKNLNPYASSGWRAFDCFTKGLYFSEGMATSCYILHASGLGVPRMSIDEFLSGYPMERVNEEFIASHFMSQSSEECLRCEYYSLCMGGCPYFKWIIGSDRDPYCEVYRKIFSLLVMEAA